MARPPTHFNDTTARQFEAKQAAITQQRANLGAEHDATQTNEMHAVHIWAFMCHIS
jgi:hypothetical protein